MRLDQPIVTLTCPIINHWRLLFNRILGNTLSSGLYSASQNIHIITWDVPMAHEIANKLKDLHKIKFHFFDQTVFLGLEQIKLMRRISQSQPDGTCAPILMYGIKGVNYVLARDKLRYLANSDWAQMMEYFLIHRYQDCLNYLENDIDVVGPEWTAANSLWKSPVGSFGYFWTKTSYYKNLPNIPSSKGELVEMVKGDPNYEAWGGAQAKSLISPRWACWIEHYIGMSENIKYFDIHRAYPTGAFPNWHYHNLYPPELYDDTYVAMNSATK
jgi:hypothetical protein